MKLTNMKIGTQLRLGLGAILFLVVALGVMAWLQTDKLWFSTKDLYEHPLQVRRAIGHLEADIESMSRHVRDLFLAQNDQEKTASLQNLEIRKTDAGRQFNILYDRYLGPRDDITTLQDDFLKWNVLREETIRLLQAGKTAEAAAGIRPGGGQAAQGDAVRSRLQKIDDFAKNKGDEFYATATAQNATITRQLAVFVIVILLLALVVAWLLLKGIKDPLAELTAATDAFGRASWMAGAAMPPPTSSGRWRPRSIPWPTRCRRK